MSPMSPIRPTPPRVSVGHPKKRALKMHQMPIDPDQEDLDELMNPVDYFNIYKRKMEELAYQKFDKQQDAVFYSYLDKLTNKEQFKKNSKVDGLKMLREFIIDPVSLTSAKKRNEQTRKWEYYL